MKGQQQMKAIVIAALLALSFTTGFTCSKSQPEQAPAEMAPATTEAAPAEGTVAPTEMAAPAEGTVAPTEAAAPTEGSAAPAGETH